jgi:hypothetical protein
MRELLETVSLWTIISILEAVRTGFLGAIIVPLCLLCSQCLILNLNFVTQAHFSVFLETRTLVSLTIDIQLHLT